MAVTAQLTVRLLVFPVLAILVAGASDQLFRNGELQRIHFFDILMDRPWGATPRRAPEPEPEPQCIPLQQTCGADTDCCQGICGIETCCIDDGETCERDADCCSGDCTGGNCNPACFAGDTRVYVQGQQSTVAIRDLQTGQYVLCLDTNDDLRLPKTPFWCLVRNWGHAEERTTQQIQITYPQPGGSRGVGSLTVSSAHRVLKLTSTSAGATGASMLGFGSFDTLRANELRRGDLIAVLTNPSNPTAGGFTVVAVSSVDRVEASGMYIPSIEHPYLIADDVVTPLRLDFPVRMVGAEGLDGAKEAVLQYMVSPPWMRQIMDNGTAGINGTWNGSVVWPGLGPILGTTRRHLDAGESLNFTALQEWFMPRYEAWQANNSVAIRLQDVVTILNTSSTWVGPERRKGHP